MDVRCECCVLSGRGLYDSSREVLPTVVCRCVLSRNLVNEESLAHWRMSRQKQTKLFMNIQVTFGVPCPCGYISRRLGGPLVVPSLYSPTQPNSSSRNKTRSSEIIYTHTHTQGVWVSVCVCVCVCVCGWVDVCVCVCMYMTRVSLDCVPPFDLAWSWIWRQWDPSNLQESSLQSPVLKLEIKKMWCLLQRTSSVYEV